MSLQVAAGPKGQHAGAGHMPWQKWAGKDRLRRFKRFAERYVTIPTGFGAGAPMVVYPPQVAIARSVLEVPVTVIEVGKGNTKSSTMAAMGLHRIADPPPGDLRPLVPVVAGSKEQARSGVYDTAVAMVKESPTLSACMVVYENLESPRIVCPQTGGVMRPYAPTPRRLHGIIPSLFLVDELGMIHDDKVLETAIASLGKRPFSAVVAFGTPGWERGVMWRLRQQWRRGELPTSIRWHSWSAPDRCHVRDRKAWRAANPMRVLLDPDGWEANLEVILATIGEREFRLLHLAQWPEQLGDVLVTKDRWAELADADLSAPPSIVVAVDGNYSRKSVAVVAAVPRDGRVDLSGRAVWEHQTYPVGTDEIVAAVLSLGLPSLVSVRDAGQLHDVAERLELEGVPVARHSSHSAAKMREPTDRWAEAITAGSVHHDAAPAVDRQILSTRLEPRRDGLTLSRDEREDELPDRIDATVAAVIAHHLAATIPNPVIY